ncbi:ADP-ribosyltransferase [Nocardia sp. NBC_00511]|uniref:ADP-ribosyltransferase n=1 Tax=Nocardia sp. NBC_00511 TaxID=2903591 RepID=UPI002F907F8A
MTDEETQDDYGFDQIPLAQVALAGQGIDRLTATERTTIQVYALSGYEQINRAMRGQSPMTPGLRERIDIIRAGLRKYPLPTAVRVTRETAAELYELVDEASAHALIYSVFDEAAFLSTSALADPPHSWLHADPVILDLIVSQGTPGLLLGELAEFTREQDHRRA